VIKAKIPLAIRDAIDWYRSIKEDLSFKSQNLGRKRPQMVHLWNVMFYGAPLKNLMDFFP